MVIALCPEKPRMLIQCMVENMGTDQSPHGGTTSQRRYHSFNHLFILPNAVPSGPSEPASRFAACLLLAINSMQAVLPIPVSSACLWAGRERRALGT